MPVVRPFRELDLADELRPRPDDVALANLRHLRDLLERRRVGAQRLELREQLVDRPLREARADVPDPVQLLAAVRAEHERAEAADRKSTRLNSSHMSISYAVFCL